MRTKCANVDKLGNLSFPATRMEFITETFDDYTLLSNAPGPVADIHCI
jgi:hypothetical protein